METIDMTTKGDKTALNRGNGICQMPPGKWITPPYLWTSTEPGQHAKDTKEGGTKDTKGTEGELLH